MSLPACRAGDRASWFKPESISGHNSHRGSKNHHPKEQRGAPLMVGLIVVSVTFATHVFAIEMLLVDLVGVEAEI